MSSDFNWYLFLPKNGWRKIVGSKTTGWATSIKKKRLIANFMSQGSQKKQKQVIPNAQNSHFCGSGRGLSRQPYPSYFLKRLIPEIKPINYCLPSH